MIVRELEVKYKKGHRIKGDTLHSPQCIFDYFKDIIGDESQETFIAIYLDIKNKLNGWIRIGKGTLGETIVHPRDIFKGALLTNSASIILCHNHPSGELVPSGEDLNTTNRIVECAKIMGINILDHVIITDSRYKSMKEERLF